MRKKRLSQLLAAVALVLLTVIPSLAASLSGSVVNNSTKTLGRIYVFLDGWPSGRGVSIAAPGAFSIRGVQDGFYQLRAFMDSNNDGFFSATEASGSTAISISSGLVSGSTTLTMYNPQYPAPLATESVNVRPGNGGAMVQWEAPKDGSGGIAAESYAVEWSSNGFATFATVAVPLGNADGAEEMMVFVPGLTNGSTYSFRVRSRIGSQSAVSEPVSALIKPPVGGHTVSGTLSFNGFTSSAKPVFVALWSGADENFYFVRYASGSSGMTFSMPGVQDGLRFLFAFVDQNANNIPDAGDYFASQRITVNTNGANVTGLSLPLSASNVSMVLASTQHMVGDNNTHSYNLWFNTEQFRKLPANVAITGPQIGTIDMNALEREIYLPVALRSNVGESYTFNISFVDGTTGSFTAQIKSVYDTPPGNLAPSGAVSVTPTTISWQPPAGFTRNGYIWVNIWGQDFNWESQTLPSTATSAAYDGSALANGQYTLSVEYMGPDQGSVARTTSFTLGPQAQAPFSVTVPSVDADGSYTVTWGASTTTGASYELQEATDSGFTTGLRTAYTGTALSTAITGRALNATYYYRVRAVKTGYTASAYRTAANGCAVAANPAGTPGSITVPVADADGAYTVSWGASATAGVSYLLQEATNASFTTGLRTAYSGTLLSAAIAGRSQNVTYYYRVLAAKPGMANSAYRSAANGCAVPGNAAVATPAIITVPAADADGAYQVSWGASATAGVAYVLQEATNTTFTAGLRTAYSGTLLSAAITGRSQNVTYYYRVVATKPGMLRSAYRTAANGCAVPGSATVATPATITVPAADADGAYTVSWGASTTAGVVYQLQEATNTTFTAGLRTAYTGTLLSAAVTARSQNVTYYYRVRATKPGMVNSAYRTATKGCAVPGSAAAAPANITVPATDADGSYSVSWGPSATAGVTYVLQEATNSGFTTGLRTAYTGAALSAAITGRSVNSTYYYRVWATKPGMLNSAYRTGVNGCQIKAAQNTLSHTAWFRGDTDPNAHHAIVIVFLDNSRYIMAENNPVDANGQPGIEHGTYSWNPTTGALTTNAVVDTNGSWGFSGGGGLTAGVSGNTLSFNVPGDGVITFTKLINTTNPLVGTWFNGYADPASHFAVVAIFLNSSQYMFIQQDGDVPGMEHGTYTWNQSTGAFTANAIVDTSGESGMSNLALGTTVSASGSTFTQVVPGEATYTAYRLY